MPVERNLRSTSARLSLMILLLFIPGVASEGSPQTAQQPTYVSMLQLLTMPEQFNGKVVSVIGFLSMNYEGYLLFAHQEDAVHVILGNAVQIEGNKQMSAETEKLDQKYVKVLGTFRASDRRRVPFYVGAIVDIRSCDFWSDPQHPASQKIRDLLRHN